MANQNTTGRVAVISGASSGGEATARALAGRRAHRQAGNAGYAATKWGMNGWSESLRQEPEDIGDVIAFTVSQLQRMTLSEVLIRPTAQSR